jgi:hypothetical protein
MKIPVAGVGIQRPKDEPVKIPGTERDKDHAKKTKTDGNKTWGRNMGRT